MPVMDGLEATREIRSMEHDRRQKPAMIIALTGLGSATSQQEAFSSGVDLYLTKPVRFSDLRDILSDWTPVIEIESRLIWGSQREQARRGLAAPAGRGVLRWCGLWCSTRGKRRHDSLSLRHHPLDAGWSIDSGICRPRRSRIGRRLFWGSGTSKSSPAMASCGSARIIRSAGSSDCWKC